MKSTPLYVYDVASCYPAGAVELPSLAAEDGSWRCLNGADLRYASLGELLERAEKATPVSMFKVRWSFPVVEKKYKPPSHVAPEDRRMGVPAIDLHAVFPITLPHQLRGHPVSGRWSFHRYAGRLRCGDQMVNALRA